MNRSWDEHCKQLDVSHSHQVTSLNSELLDIRRRLDERQKCEDERQTEFDELLLAAKKQRQDEEVCVSMCVCVSVCSSVSLCVSMWGWETNRVWWTTVGCQETTTGRGGLCLYVCLYIYVCLCVRLSEWYLVMFCDVCCGCLHSLSFLSFQLSSFSILFESCLHHLLGSRGIKQ